MVASRWPGLAEVIADGETGVLVAPGDKAALARETRALLDDPERRRRLGEAGRRRATERFGAEAMVRNHESLYAALTTRTRASEHERHAEGYRLPSIAPTGVGGMSDNLNDLPKFPTDDSKQYEEALGQHEDRPDRLIDRLRHAWPVYLIFGGLLGLWAIAVAVLALTGANSALLLLVLVLPVAVECESWPGCGGGGGNGSVTPPP